MAKYNIIPSSRTIVQSPISIGHKAEKGVEAIEFDVTAWVETYGSGTLTVVMQRWGDAIPYPIALKIDENNKATWTLSDTDTAKAGMAYAQLNYIVGDEVVKKSDIYTFRVMDSLTGEGEPPEAYDSWLEQLTHLAAEAMAEVLDIEGVVTDKTLTVDGGIADAKATGDALALKADKSTTYTKTEVDQMIEDVEDVEGTLYSIAKMSDAYESFRIIVAVGGISPEGAPNTTNRKQRKGFKGCCAYLKKGSMITTDETICKMKLVKYSSSQISESTFVSMSPNYLASYTVEEDGYYTLLFAKDDNTEITDNEHANIEASTYLTVAKTNGQVCIPFATYSRDSTNTFVGVVGSSKAVLTAVSGDSGFYKIRTANDTVFKCCLCGENDVFVESSGSTAIASKETALEKTNRIFIAMQKPAFTAITVNDVATFISDLSVAFFPNKTERAYGYAGQCVTLGQTFDYRFLGKVAQYGGGNKPLQGMAQYDGKLIVLYDTGYYNVYAIGPFNSTPLGSGLLESTDASLHCNTCSLGAMHTAGDPFPLLYVAGSDNSVPGYCSVERIKPDYTNEHIQTIFIDYTNFAQAGYIEEFTRPNFYVDRGFLYTFSAKYRTNGSEEAHDSENRFVIHKYALPDTSIATVTLTAADVLAEYILPYNTYFQQGGTTHNGKLFQLFGCGGAIKGSKQALNALRIYNLDDGYEMAQIDLSQVPASNEEIESAAVFGNKLLLNYITGNICILTFSCGEISLTASEKAELIGLLD